MYEVVDGVYRLPLPLPGDNLRAVNCFVLQGSRGASLIDPGVATDVARDRLAAGLETLAMSPSDVDHILVSHIHYDHYSQAIAHRRVSGTPVWLGRHEEKSLQQIRRGDRPYPAQVALLQRFGAPTLAHEFAAFIGQPDLLELLGEAPDRWIDDGTSVPAGSGPLLATHTPGHTRGHVVFRDEERQLLYAGDHVLPSITPSIGFEPAPIESPLATYLSSLHTVRSAPDARLLPAHGPVAGSVHACVDELLAHHDLRLKEIQGQVGLDSASAADIAGQIPWTRRKRRFDELDPFNQGLAVLETGFHLELLVEQGRVQAAPDGEAVRYEAA